MAIDGVFYGKTSNSAIKPRITWEAVADALGNYSDVTATLSYSRKDSYETYGHWAGTLTIDGDTGSVSGHYMVISKDSNTVAITHKARVAHNDNGSRTVTISATGSISGTTLTKTTISSEVTLETIPRAASVAASDGDIGSTVMVTLGKKSEAHSYEIAYAFGELQGFLTENGLQDQALRTQASCLAFPLPESFYGQIPDSATGQCVLTCTTYQEDVQIGQPQQAAFTVRANPDRCGPLLTGTVTDGNPLTVALTGDESVLVRDASTALCRIDAAARCQAELKRIKIADQLVTGDCLEIPLVQEESFRFWTEDSRGYTAEQTVQAAVIPYFLPVVRLEAVRSDAVSGQGQLTARGSFYNGSFGAAQNSLQLRWRLNEDHWQEAAPVVEDNSFTCQVQITGMDYTQAHRITLEVTDALHQITATADIQPGIPVFDWGREDFAFHVPVWIQDVQILQELLQLKARALSRTGDSMEGPLDLGEHALTGLPQPEQEGDAVPKSYADRKPEIRKLWVNPDPDAGFDAQSIALDLENAGGVSVLYRNVLSGTLYLDTGLIPKGYKSSMRYTTLSNAITYRNFTVDPTGVTFDRGINGQGSGDSDVCVPVAISAWYSVNAEGAGPETGNVGYLPGPVGAAAGQYIRVKSLNESGGVLETESVDQPTMVLLTQGEYEALDTVDESLLYLIVRDS